MAPVHRAKLAREVNENCSIKFSRLHDFSSATQTPLSFSSEMASSASGEVPIGSSSGDCPLLYQLPPEVRLRIYPHIFTDFNVTCEKSWKNRSILATCRLPRAEAMRAYYDRTTSILKECEEALARVWERFLPTVESDDLVLLDEAQDKVLGCRAWRDSEIRAMKQEGFPVEKWAKAK